MSGITLSQEQLAAMSPELLAVLFSGSTPASPVAAPVAPIGTSAKPPKTVHQEVLGLLFNRQIDPAYRPYPTKASFGEMIAQENRQRNVLRPNGTVGTHYPLVYDLSEAEALALVPILEGLPKAKGKAPSASRSQSGYRPQQQAAAPTADPRIDRMEALLAELVRERYSEPATPVAAPGFSQTPVPATPVQPEVAMTALVPGQAVTIGGEVRYVSDDGKRLNKFPSN